MVTLSSELPLSDESIMGTDHESKQELDDWILRAANGDSSAYEPIVKRFERPLRAWVASHAPPGVDVDEVAQRAFIAAYTRLGEFQVGTNFSAWLFSIAKYQLRTELTRIRRLADYHSRFSPSFLEHSIEDPNIMDSDRWSSRLEYLQECVKKLSLGHSQFLTWRYHDQISIEEMAIASGRSPGAVKKQLWSVRQRLLKCIELRIAAEGESNE